LPSELIRIYGSYGQLAGHFGRVIRPVMRPLATQDNTNTGETRTEMHASSGTWTYDLSVWADKDISRSRPRT
jgi:hypothetical protein